MVLLCKIVFVRASLFLIAPGCIFGHGHFKPVAPRSVRALSREMRRISQKQIYIFAKKGFLTNPRGSNNIYKVDKLKKVNANNIDCLLHSPNRLKEWHWKSNLTLVRVPKINYIKGFLGSVLTPKRALGSFLTPADPLKSLSLDARL